MKDQYKAPYREYKTLESETIILFSTVYSVLSLFLVGIVFRFFLPKNYEFIVFSAYACSSFLFLIYISIQARKRTKINKLPSADVLEVLYFFKEKIKHEGDSFETSPSSFNNEAMIALYDEALASNIPPHDYFSYLLVERYIKISSFTFTGHYTNFNSMYVMLSEKSLSRLKIYEDAESW